MPDLPSISDIQVLHRRSAPSEDAYQLVFGHSEIVSEIADQLMETQAFSATEKALVLVGCLLHDIGAYRLYDETGNIDHANYIQHGILGYDLLRAEGFENTICRFASCHTGVGLTSSDIAMQNLPLPPGNYLAETRAERLVMYADKFHSKTTPPKFMTARSYEKQISRFGPDKKARFLALVAEFGEPNLTHLSREYGFLIT